MISVIIPTYNRAQKLIRSLKSVTGQTVSDIEIIVVDDGSTDNTEEAVESVHDYRIRYIKLEGNMGGGAARNAGIVSAQGKYIAFQDSDDVWHRNKLEVESGCLEEHDADVVFCKMVKIVDGKRVGTVPGSFREGFIEPGSDVYGIGTPTLLGKSSVFKDNLFDVRLPRFQELELLIRLSGMYRIYCCDQALMDNYFDQSSGATSSNPQKLLKASQILLEKYPGLGSRYPYMSRRIATNLLVQSYRKDVDRIQQKKMHDMAVRIDPSGKNLLKYVSARLGIFPLLNSAARNNKLREL